MRQRAGGQFWPYHDIIFANQRGENQGAFSREALMITDVPGIQVGHATDEAHHTGCMVILCPTGTVGGGEFWMLTEKKP
ncbi:MAG: hypothetical protein ACE5E7_04605 [Anaerolineae bacterium]